MACDLHEGGEDHQVECEEGTGGGVQSTHKVEDDTEDEDIGGVERHIGDDCCDSLDHHVSHDQTGGRMHVQMQQDDRTDS